MNFHNIGGAFALTLLFLTVTIGVIMFVVVEEEPQNYLLVDASEFFTESFSFEPNTGILMTLTAEGKMEIGDPPIAIVDLETGHVFLHGDPNEAAMLFWEAVELMKP